MIRPGTDWENKAPEILCESISGVGVAVGSALLGTYIGGVPGAIIGAVAQALAGPSLEYALCGGYETTSPPLDGENELPEPNITFNLEVDRTIKTEVYEPPKQINSEIVRRIYKEDDEPKGPGFTKFPLQKAISARESLKNRKFGCILYQPVSDERIKLSKCNIQRPSNNPELDDKQRLINFIVAQESNTLATGVCIMSTVIGGRINTGIVVGPYILSATATAYAAFNKQMYSAPITKIPKGVEYESCEIPAPSIDVGFSIKKDTRVKFEPFVEITSPVAGVSN
jgi:hypothetical protein